MTLRSPLENLLLAALKPGVYSRLLPELDLVELESGHVLYDAGDAITHVYFPASCIVSLISTAADGAYAQLAMTGNDGLVGVPLLLGQPTMSFRAVVQSAGAAFRLDAEVLLWELDQARDLQRQALHYCEALMNQMARTAVCHRHHTVDQQMSRWLLMCLDRLPGSQIDLTQARIADVLGVRREAVLEAAKHLQATGAIAHHRGHINVLDRGLLHASACACYVAAEREYPPPRSALSDTFDRHPPRPNPASLRGDAEAHLRRKDDTREVEAREPGRLLHEMQVHQIELEMQKVQLDDAYLKADALRARYADLYDFAPVAYVSVDPLGFIRQVNLAGAILLGIKRSEIARHRFASALAETSLPAFNGFLQRVLEGHSRERCELELRASAQRGAATILLEAVRDEDGEECRMVLTDITAQKQSTRALMESEARYRQLIDGLPLGVIIAQDGIFRLTNSRLLEMLGYSEQEISGSLILPKIAEADRRMATEYHLRRMAGQPAPSTYEIQFLAKDGRQIDCFVHAATADWEGRNASLGVIEDITERKRINAALASSELRERTLINALPDFVLLLDNAGRVTHFHSPPEQIALLVAADTPVGKPYQEVIAPDFAALLGQHLAELASDEQLRYFSVTVEFGGLTRDFDARLCRVFDSSQCPTGFLLVAHDVTAVRELRTQEQLVVAALGALGDGAVITNAEGAIEWLNPAFEALTGYSLDEAIHKSVDELINSGQHDQAFYAEMWSTIWSGRTWRGELINTRKDGSFYDAELTIAPVKGPSGAILHFVGIQHDISKRKRLEAELKSLASTDPLTGLPNRRHFMTRLEEELSRVLRREGYRVAVLMLDLDHFKRVNDSLGHAGGDAVLRQFSSLLGEELRKGDMAGRLGGEEFAMVLPDCDRDTAGVFAERLRAKVERSFGAQAGQAALVTVSIGIAEIEVTDSSIDAALDRADTAMYRAKESGRNRIEVANCGVVAGE
jgi:diguanylate cyclase (GGDEF)-like protein/PAS domain S-box-containing protein